MKHQSRPTIVEAEQFFPDNPSHPIPFAADGIVMPPGACECGRSCALCRSHWIQTANGPIKLLPGDWVLRREVDDGESVFTEVWPVKPYIFERSYDPIGERAVTVDDIVPPGLLAIPLHRDAVSVRLFGVEYTRAQVETHNQRVNEYRTALARMNATVEASKNEEPSRAKKVRARTRKPRRRVSRKSKRR